MGIGVPVIFSQRGCQGRHAHGRGAGCPRKSFFIFFARRLRRRGGEKWGGPTPPTGAGRPCEPRWRRATRKSDGHPGIELYQVIDKPFVLSLY
jgi:hypothetical protein